MTDPKSQMIEDRYLRDSARALLDADIEQVKASLEYKSIGQRAVERVKDTAVDAYDDARDLAEHNKGAVAAIVAAIVLWLARNPILDLLGFDREEEENNDDGAEEDEWDEDTEIDDD